MITKLDDTNMKERLIELLMDGCNLWLFYINKPQNVWYIEDHGCVPKSMISKDKDPINAIYSSGDIHEEDRPLYKEFCKRLETWSVQGTDEVFSQIRFRLKNEIGEYVWYAMKLHFIKEGNKITEIVGKMAAMSNAEILERRKLRCFTNDKHPEIFGKQIEDFMHSRPYNKYAFIQFDIVKFKLINDKYGEETGTELLNHIGDVLEAFCHEGQLNSRLSADVFMIVTPYNEIEDIYRFIRGLERRIVNYRGLNYDMAFGVYLVEDINAPSRTMGDCAAMARMNIKRKAVDNIGFYDSTMKNSLKKSKKIEDGMKNALKNNEFRMYLQPKYSISENKIIGAEALVRWIHPEDGIIPPNEFIPVFEENGFVIKLDEYIWECACAHIRRWLDLGYQPVPISVNVSRLHLNDNDFIGCLNRLVRKYNISKKLIELEITETIENINLNTMIKNAKSEGFTLLMDDFGSGYSSLNTLETTPFDVLKIDRTFLSSSMESSRGQKIISHTISMTRDIGLDVIAEGVETKEQAEFLSGCGCDAAQGFYYSKAIPPEEFDKLLRKDMEKAAQI